MYFKFDCPSCEKSLKVSEELAGRKCACPYCRASVRIPVHSTIGQPSSGAPNDGFPGININTGQSPAPNAGKAPPRKAAAPKAKAPATQAQTQSTQAAPTESGEGKWTDSTDVGMVVSGLIGLGSTTVFYLLLAPLRQFQVVQLFWDRGWVPFVITFLTFWSFAILLLKSRKLKRQKAAMLFDVLPTELSEEITHESLNSFLNHVHQLPGEAGESFLINRVVRGIEHFRVRKSTAETVTMMASQSEIDANNVTSSYTLLKVFIWALPIMGFIGTVIGVSSAVAGLAGSLENASDVSAIKGSLNEVFGGLGTAFDTTLLALVLSMMVKIPASAMQKSEEDLITWVDEYCNENLLKRLNDGREGGAERGMGGTGGVDPDVIRGVFQSAMGTYHEEWTKQIQQMNDSAAQLQQTFSAMSKQTEQMQMQLLHSVSGTNESLQTHFSGLERGLSGLTSVLEKLGEQQVVVQQVEAPRRGLFSRRKNGRR